MDTLYLKLPQKKNVISQRIVLGDIADIICTNKELEAKVKAILLKRFSDSKKQRAVFSVNDLIGRINGISPSVTVVPIGEADVLIEYIPKPTNKFMEGISVFIVGIISFIGAAFTMMTFNNDVSSADLFSNLYQQMTGRPSDGFTVLELFYSIGLPIGIIIFFNHISGRKLSTDPTPLEVEMKQYEYNTNNSLIADSNRKEATNNVD